MLHSSIILLAVGSYAFAEHVKYTATGTCYLPKAQATALTESPTSNVAGKAFDKILTVYLETTSFGNATADRTFSDVLK